MEERNTFEEAQDPVEDQRIIDDLMYMFGNPKQLLSESRKVGGKGIGRVVLVIFLFVLTNFICLIAGIIKMISLKDASSAIYLLMILLVGIILTILASSKAYNFALVDALGKLYTKIAPIVRKICSVIIDKAENVFKTANEAKEGKLREVMDFGTILQSTFKNLPGFVRRIFVKMLNKTPISALLIDLKADIVEGRKQEATTKLHAQIDTYLNESFFNQNTTNWMYWLLPINIIIQYLLISYGMK